MERACNALYTSPFCTSQPSIKGIQRHNLRGSALGGFTAGARLLPIRAEPEDLGTSVRSVSLERTP